MLAVDSLTYKYQGAAKAAVDNLTFRVSQGEILGLLGPNGAGKTTTQKILTGLLQGYEGVVEVAGRDLRSLGPGYYNHIGVCFEQPNLYHQLTAEENLEFYRGFFNVPTQCPASLLELLDLPLRDRRTAGQYSKGMRMRLALARSLLNRPRLWFLDEPTSGQDPGHSVLIRDIIRHQRNQGVTVFLTTHDMHLADELCDRVALQVDGAIKALESPSTLRLGHAGKTVRVQYRPPAPNPTAAGMPADLLFAEFAIDEPTGKAAFLGLVAGNHIETIHTNEPELEDVFLRIAGSRLASRREAERR